MQPSPPPALTSAFSPRVECFITQGVLSARLPDCRQRTNEWSSVEEVDKDNSELLDAGAATQQLSTDDIAAMRAAGKTGEEIAAALAEGSATFLSKTQFSQAKYKKKKQKKYSIFATLQRPSARSICEVCKHHIALGW